LNLSQFGFTEGINEIIAITKSEDGLNAAPIGIIVENANGKTAKIKLFPSHTKENIEKGSPLWANINFDPIIFVLAAFEDPSIDYYISVDPPILKGSYAYCEFKCEPEDDIVNLELINGKVLNLRLRAVNRGFNALIEACIHATRYKLGMEHLKGKIEYYGEIIQKCGSKKEKDAYRLLLKFIKLDTEFKSLG